MPPLRLAVVVIAIKKIIDIITKVLRKISDLLAYLPLSECLIIIVVEKEIVKL